MKKAIFIMSMLIAAEVGAGMAPTVYNTYDGAEPGARALGMGLSFTCVGDDPASIYFNPAGLYGIEEGLLSFSYEVARQSELQPSELFRFDSVEGRNLSFLAIVSSKGAFSYRPLSSKIFRSQNGADWVNTEIKINQYTVSVAAQEKNVYTGLNISYLSGRIGQSKIVSGVPGTVISNGDGISCDIGVIYKLSNEFKFGFNLQNLAGFMWWDDYETEQLPLFFRTGMSLAITNFMTFSTDWEKKYYRIGADTKETVHFGIEQNLGKILKVQVGMYGENLNDSSLAHYTAGLDYSLRNYGFAIAGEKYKMDSKDVMRYVFSLNIPI